MSRPPLVPTVRDDIQAMESRHRRAVTMSERLGHSQLFARALEAKLEFEKVVEKNINVLGDIPADTLERIASLFPVLDELRENLVLAQRSVEAFRDKFGDTIRSGDPPPRHEESCYAYKERMAEIARKHALDNPQPPPAPRARLVIPDPVYQKPVYHEGKLVKRSVQPRAAPDDPIGAAIAEVRDNDTPRLRDSPRRRRDGDPEELDFN